MHRPWYGALLFFISFIKFQGYMAKNIVDFELGVSGLSLQFQFAYGYGMMHKARHSKVEES